MRDIPKLENLDVSGKTVLLRADLDLKVEKQGGPSTSLRTNSQAKSFGDFRLSSLIPTIDHLLKNKAKIVIIGHRGRPLGSPSLSLSLREVSEKLSELLGKKIKFVDEVVGEKVTEELKNMRAEEIIMLENLRFDPREEKNDEEFAKTLASYGDVYVNECFSTSHRKHASFVGIPKYLPRAAGFHLIEEVENLSKVLKNPRRPVVIIISGIKKDKLKYVDGFLEFADKILIAGRLPEYLPEDLKHEKLVIAKLMPDKEDITMRSIEMFEDEIARAGTIVVSGPIGKFENEGHLQGTKRVFEAVANNESAFKVAGGGETIKAVNSLSLSEQFDWMSVGGGAMLEYLTKGTLPGIEGLIN